MKALSLTQPWATLIIIGAKSVETRSWMTQYSGPIAIHASKKFPDEDKDLCMEPPFRQALRAGGILGPADLPTGAILGTAVLRGCRFTEDVAHQLSAEEQAFGNYEPGRFAWFLQDARRIAIPIPCRGKLGLWTVPPEIAEQLKAVLA